MNDKHSMPRQLTMVGTGASEGIPGMFCCCELCNAARRLQGKNIRARTSYLLGEHIFIDLGPDTLMQGRKFHLPLEKLRHVFISHSHTDHLLPLEFWCHGVSQCPDGIPLKVYGSQTVREAISAEIHGDWTKFGLEFIQLGVGTVVELPELDLKVTALEANHKTDPEQSLLYLFESSVYRLLIATDTGEFPESLWRMLAGKRLDVVAIDATWGKDHFDNSSHLGLPDVVEHVEKLKAIGAADDRTLVLPTHFAHIGGLLHHQMEEYLKPYGNITPAYDGQVIKLSD
ncbi:MBL fold metallo-hydrolase [Victivallis sp. Marseille-Q1083]|uniref:MBL fold metallo-hydrolase n=1 Tax=Victivallis sp. Marseille-Q1083 TaxID=2717288 RepID=UPI0015894AAA|nr:MBL fold metallo-hydrolase [Victivallis sp. Marseille-Q1083]